MKKIATLLAVLALSSTAFAADEVLQNVPEAKSPAVADANAGSNASPATMDNTAAPAAPAKAAKGKKHACSCQDKHKAEQDS